MSQNKEQVIIVGAGIAGLSLAVQLAEKNIACVVLEVRTHFDEPTSGVRISAQGVKILEKIKISDVGEGTERIVMNFSGITADFAVNNPPRSSPAIIVTRRAIFEKLMERVNSLGIEVVTGFKLQEVKENADGVIVTSDIGQSVRGKFLVGADGVGSVVRKILNPGLDSGKAYAGYLGVGLIFPNDSKVEMTSFIFPGHKVGLASIGKVSAADTQKNLFLWTHLYMPEADAKIITNEKVIEMMTANSQHWSQKLKKLFDGCKNDLKTIIAHGPVYNGKVPAKWHSKKIILMGDAAHPYGPGGQGISMALKDAEALCALFVSGINEEKMARFQVERAKEARQLGESSEERNKPENQIMSSWGVIYTGLLMKVMHLFKGGKIKL